MPACVGRVIDIDIFFIFLKYPSDVAGLLKRYIPETYASEDVLHTDEYGPLPVAKDKGEGGRSDLATRIGDNFYNQYLRYLFFTHFFASNICLDVYTNSMFIV